MIENTGNEHENQWSFMRKVFAWLVHFYTALGLVVAAVITMLILRVDEPNGGLLVRWIFMLMLIATLIDGTDGTLARLVHIKKVVPGFDGRRLDDLVDFLNYTCLPLLLIWKLDVLPEGQSPWLIFALLASAYGFCQVEAKTDDGYFLGFPSYWNLVAFYLYVLQPLPRGIALTMVITLAILTFLPLRYLYPSQRGKLNLITNVLAGVWIIVVLYLLFLLPREPLSPESSGGNARHGLALASLFFPLHYLGASWIISWRHWRASRSSGSYSMQ